jgi:adenine deaminase
VEATQDFLAVLDVTHHNGNDLLLTVVTASDIALGRRGAVMAMHHALAADLLLINGRVLTMDVHYPVTQAVAVQDGKIVAVGTNAEVEPLAGVATQVIDLDGRTAMPGLTDCHVHRALVSVHGIP